MGFVYIKGKQFSTRTLGLLRIFYLLCGMVMIILGLILCLATFVGLFFVAFGVWELFMSRKYSKLLKQSKQKTEEPVSFNVIENTDIKAEKTITEAKPFEPETIPEPTPQAPSLPEYNNSEKHKVTGTSHYLDNLLSIGFENSDYSMTKKELVDSCMEDVRVYQYYFVPTDVELVKEPDNQYDPNAIKVLIDGQHVGYIKAGSCAHIHKLIDNDQIVHMTAYVGGGKYKVLHSVFDEDKCDYVDKVERHEHPYFADITIYTK